jgi:hypothetical protein
MMPLYIKNQLVSFLFIILSSPLLLAQDDCGSALTITDLTGITSRTSIPSSTNALAAGSSEEGNKDTWFQFTAQGNSANITVSSTVNNWSPEFLVVSGSAASPCTEFTEISSNDQDGNYNQITTTTALTIDETYWIVVSSNNDNSTGILSASVTNPSAPAACVDNEDCSTASTITLNASGGGDACVNDCNTGASNGPNFTGTNCYDLPNETVWYSITTDATTATINISLTSVDLSEPEFTLFTNSCSAFTIVDCAEGTGGSATSTQINVLPSTTYLIAVSDVAGDEGSFDLCISQESNNSDCNVSNTLAVSSTSMGSPLTGPFQAGEVVTFCYTINSYISTNCNYLQGIVPTFGNGWDPVSFDTQGQPLNLSTPLSTIGVLTTVLGTCGGDPAGAWSWFPDGSVTYNLNSANPLGLTTGDNAGAGWFFLTSYDVPSAACNSPETDPNSCYGDNSFNNCVTLGGWQVCFSLQVKDAISCSVGETDCSVSMKTFSDGEIGAWTSTGCAADMPTSLPGSVDCILLATDLIAFDGKQIENQNSINWTIDNTTSIDDFRIEKSLDGINWTTLDLVNGNPELTNYSYTDHIPFFPLTYYKLKMVDLDGSITKSSIISISSDKELGSNLTTELHPNPAKDYIQFEYTGNDFNSPLNIHIVNMVGQTIANYTIDQMDLNEPNQINTANLPHGIYYISIIQGGLKSTKKVTIIQ